MSDLIVYGNDFNFMPLPKLTENEMNFFIAIISELKENRELEFNFMDFAYDLHLKSNLSAMELESIFYKLAEKMLNFKVKYKTKNKAYAFICFERLCLDFGANKIEIKAQEDFYELITNLQMGFTKFELKEFMSLSGKYTKTLYRLLKQFKNTGEVTIYKNNFQDFCNIMQIPTSYKIADIDKRILNPAIKELSNEKQTIFKNLTYKKIKDPKGRGRGGKVIGIEFTFDKETNETNENNKSKEDKPEIQTTNHIEPNLDLYNGKLIIIDADNNARILNVVKQDNNLKVTYALTKNGDIKYNKLFNSIAELESNIEQAKAKNQTITAEKIDNLVKKIKI